MLTILGATIVTLAGFLAEVGDLHDYDCSQQIIRLAGFNLKENSSGKNERQIDVYKARQIQASSFVVPGGNANGSEERRA